MKRKVKSTIDDLDTMTMRSIFVIYEVIGLYNMREQCLLHEVQPIIESERNNLNIYNL